MLQAGSTFRHNGKCSSTKACCVVPIAGSLGIMGCYLFICISVWISDSIIW